MVEIDLHFFCIPALFDFNGDFVIANYLSRRV